MRNAHTHPMSNNHPVFASLIVLIQHGWYEGVGGYVADNWVNKERADQWLR